MILIWFVFPATAQVGVKCEQPQKPSSKYFESKDHYLDHAALAHSMVESKGKSYCWCLMGQTRQRIC